jgi:antitoxin (DNA-binding transcriptional repressor) of toxin-antitoxin stability system
MGIETSVRETIVITRGGRPMADLVPRRLATARWLSPDEVAEVIEQSAADPGLRDDLEQLVGETTDDLGPIR